MEPFGGDSDFLWRKPGGTLMLRAVDVNGVRFGTIGEGPSVPSYTGCSSLPRSAMGGVSVPALEAGTRLCVETAGGNPAGLRADEIQPDEDVVISFVTWEGIP